MYLKLLKDKDNYYEYGDCLEKKLCSNLEMHILEVFLLCDVTNLYKIYLELLHDDPFYGTTGDTTFLMRENGYICLSDAIFGPEEGEEEFFFKMPLKEYINIITTWGTKIFIDDKDKRPSEVLIRYENEQFFFDIKD